MVQGLVNSFGPTVMAAFAAAVKIDAFAYMPVQDFGNAFSTFIAQNYGAQKEARIRAGLKGAVGASKREKLKSSWRASAICASRVPFTAGSAACSCCTAYTGRWVNQG